MQLSGLTSITLVVINILVSYQGFQNAAFFDRYKFEVDAVLKQKQYYRLLTGGFLHVSWTHVIFNMVSLFLFTRMIEWRVGLGVYLLIYICSQLGGSLISLFFHRNHGRYSAVGASASVAGVIFASIALAPNMLVSLLVLPVSFPAWLFGLAFALFSIYAIRSGKNNIGHDAHLAGALIGVVLVVLFYPHILLKNYSAILLIILPGLAFVLFIMYRPQSLMINNLFYLQERDHYSIDHLYNVKRALRQQEVDNLLDKISKKGMKSLSEEERSRLEEFARSV